MDRLWTGYAKGSRSVPNTMNKKFVSPKCCKLCEDSATIFLMVPASFFDGDLETPPKWYIRAKDNIGYHDECDDVIEAKFCPFCATPVPEIEPASNEVARKLICSVIDGGYYCQTCELKLQSCKCYRPEFRWKPKEVAK